MANILGLLELALGGISLKTGLPVLTKEMIALLSGGGALLEPTIIGETLFVTGLILQLESAIYGYASDNLQDINNEIVRSGALENGGSITATLTDVTITSTDGTSRSVPSIGVGF